jgi:hypothetical protein
MSEGNPPYKLAELIGIEPINWPLSSQSGPFQIGAYPIRYSETKYAEVAKRTFRLTTKRTFFDAQNSALHLPHFPK